MQYQDLNLKQRLQVIYVICFIKTKASILSVKSKHFYTQLAISISVQTLFKTFKPVVCIKLELKDCKKLLLLKLQEVTFICLSFRLCLKLSSRIIYHIY